MDPKFPSATRRMECELGSKSTSKLIRMKTFHEGSQIIKHHKVKLNHHIKQKRVSEFRGRASYNT